MRAAGSDRSRGGACLVLEEEDGVVPSGLSAPKLRRGGVALLRPGLVAWVSADVYCLGVKASEAAPSCGDKISSHRTRAILLCWA